MIQVFPANAFRYRIAFNALSNLKAKLKSIFKKKDEKKQATEPTGTEAAAPAAAATG